jgi:cellulose synthase/poly-beta-1,6-N-acetylglucosamine synthase-like glycosyltransferase
VDIFFSERKNGQSKVEFTKTALELAHNSAKLRLHPRKIYNLKPTNGDQLYGAGLAFKRRRYITHTTLPYNQSAFHTLATWQKLVILSLLSLLVVGIASDVSLTLKVIIATLSSIYFLDVIFSLFLLVKSLHFSPEITVPSGELAKIKDSELPIYSILCPLYREAAMVPHFIEALEEVDWPKDKLDVILLLEEDDQETVEAVQSMDLPQYARIFVVPHSFPKTKPKACNFDLVFAKGEYVVIFDAEDRPEKMQLKKAYLAFEKNQNKFFCLQSKLNFYNPNHNLLTKLFTAEYSLWFDIILQGIQSIEATIPLGGTSNHFRTADLKKLQGWDPFNVTEDCDLGVRIFKQGLKTAIIDSTTFEEANSSLPNWLRQRSRWIKGYFQTYNHHVLCSLQPRWSGYRSALPGTGFLYGAYLFGLRKLHVLI